ncbi:MAG TPA: hypothetical protein VJ110_02985 [Candidatus Nanoarchaeia archaeon]|nr:hypothetical protein [Candidatus Nanoarchaeia archaeon]
MKKKKFVKKFFGIWNLSEKKAAKLKRKIKKDRKGMQTEFVK